MRTDPGCAGERILLLHDDRIREVYNDVAAVYLLSEGWIDVTGVQEFEDACTRIRNEGSNRREGWHQTPASPPTAT